MFRKKALNLPSVITQEQKARFQQVFLTHYEPEYDKQYLESKKLRLFPI